MSPQFKRQVARRGYRLISSRHCFPFTSQSESVNPWGLRRLLTCTDRCQRNRVIYIIVHHHRSYSTSTSSSPSSLSQTRRQSTLVTPISSNFFGRPKQFHFRRVLNITFAFPGKRSAAMQTSRGAPFPSSNLTSYVAMIWANSAFTSLTAKNRPGLIPNSNESRQGS